MALEACHHRAPLKPLHWPARWSASHRRGDTGACRDGQHVQRRDEQAGVARVLPPWSSLLQARRAARVGRRDQLGTTRAVPRRQPELAPAVRTVDPEASANGGGALGDGRHAQERAGQPTCARG